MFIYTFICIQYVLLSIHSLTNPPNLQIGMWSATPIVTQQGKMIVYVGDARS